MCGICGFTGAGNEADLQKMTESLSRRGPDDKGFFNDEAHQLYLGHRRLSVLDMEGGHQPMSTADGELTVVFNGEIYNYGELRKVLVSKGHTFRSDHSDTEVLLHGYREWGAQLPQKLNGMWAFAIADIRNATLFISRDRFGKKPLFYSRQNGSFVFSSELTSLLKHPGISSTLNNAALKKYFAYGYAPAPLTLVSEVFKLPAGHNLLYDFKNGRLKTEQYWQFTIAPVTHIPARAEEVWAEELLYLLDKAVQRRLVADVPLGVFLSGGLDSSTVTALAAKYAGNGRLKTFSIGFSEKSYDESGYAAQVAAHLHTDHYAEELSMQKALGLMPSIAAMLDEPISDSSILPTYLLSAVTRKHVTVALGGDGADELLAGYNPFNVMRMAALYQKWVPKALHPAIAFLAARLPTLHSNVSLDYKIKNSLRAVPYPESTWNPIWLGPLAPKQVEELFGEKIPVEELYSEAIQLWDSTPQLDSTDRVLNFFTSLYLQNDILVKADRASMMNSLEVRSPFLDIDVVNFVRTIPHQYKYRNGVGKYLLKKAVAPLLPHSIIYRSKKGFGVPTGKWFADGLVDIASSSEIPLNKAFANKLMQEHRLHKADHKSFLWSYWLLAHWMKNLR